VSVSLDKTPILGGLKEVEPFILGGTPTKEFKYVVALLIDGEMHCTGTVVASRAVLTAAHCIHGYEKAIESGRMTFVSGTYITQPEVGPKQIEGYDYPRGPEIRFNPSLASLEHDIGVVYAREQIGIPAAVLHASIPKWDDIVRKVEVYFVGFGYTKASEVLIGSGAKREAPWEVATADDLRFYYQFPKKSTCKGDSGGPAFVKASSDPGSALVLVGVTSAGDAACMRGMNTRVDAHRSWLDPRLK
jgi:hypothetical protein